MQVPAAVFDRRQWLIFVWACCAGAATAALAQTAAERDLGIVIERMSESARRMLFYARAAVSRYGGRSILPFHLLWGALQEMGTAIDPMLAAGWSAARLQERVVGLMPVGLPVSEAIEIPFDPASARMLRQSGREADDLGSSAIEREHVLLAIVSGQQGEVSQVLLDAGLTRSAVLGSLAGKRQ